jgi:hypothetical protein
MKINLFAIVLINYRLKLIFQKFDEALRKGEMKEEGKYNNNN